MEGSGVTTDMIEADKWFNLAVRNGDPTANKYIRDLETSGVLTPEEIDEAHRRADEHWKEWRSHSQRQVPGESQDK
jgi:hypothetical protein